MGNIRCMGIFEGIIRKGSLPDSSEVKWFNELGLSKVIDIHQVEINEKWILEFVDKYDPEKKQSTVNGETISLSTQVFKSALGAATGCNGQEGYLPRDKVELLQKSIRFQEWLGRFENREDPRRESRLSDGWPMTKLTKTYRRRYKLFSRLIFFSPHRNYLPNGAAMALLEGERAGNKVNWAAYWLQNFHKAVQRIRKKRASGTSSTTTTLVGQIICKIVADLKSHWETSSITTLTVQSVVPLTLSSSCSEVIYTMDSRCPMMWSSSSSDKFNIEDCFRGPLCQLVQEKQSKLSLNTPTEGEKVDEAAPLVPHLIITPDPKVCVFDSEFVAGDQSPTHMMDGSDVLKINQVQCRSRRDYSSFDDITAKEYAHYRKREKDSCNMLQSSGVNLGVEKGFGVEHHGAEGLEVWTVSDQICEEESHADLGFGEEKFRGTLNVDQSQLQWIPASSADTTVSSFLEDLGEAHGVTSSGCLIGPPSWIANAYVVDASCTAVYHDMENVGEQSIVLDTDEEAAGEEFWEDSEPIATIPVMEMVTTRELMLELRHEDRANVDAFLCACHANVGIFPTVTDFHDFRVVSNLDTRMIGLDVYDFGHLQSCKLTKEMGKSVMVEWFMYGESSRLKIWSQSMIRLWLGTFDTAEEAAFAYDQAAYKLRAQQHQAVGAGAGVAAPVGSDDGDGDAVILQASSGVDTAVHEHNMNITSGGSVLETLSLQQESSMAGVKSVLAAGTVAIAAREASKEASYYDNVAAVEDEFMRRWGLPTGGHRYMDQSPPMLVSAGESGSAFSPCRSPNELECDTLSSANLENSSVWADIDEKLLSNAPNLDAADLTWDVFAPPRVSSSTMMSPLQTATLPTVTTNHQLYVWRDCK